MLFRQISFLPRKYLTGFTLKNLVLRLLPWHVPITIEIGFTVFYRLWCRENSNEEIMD